MPEQKKPVGQRMIEMMAGNLAATVSAKDEGKKVALAYMMNGQDEIIRAMDIVPAYGEIFGGMSSQLCIAERYLQKAEADNFSRSLCTYATCTLGFDIWRQECGGDMPPDPTGGGMGKPDMILGSAQQLCDPRFAWSQATQHYYKDIPLFTGGMYYPPWDPNVDYREYKDQERLYVKYATEELREMVKFCEKHTDSKMDWDRLAAIIDLSDRTWDLFVENCELRKATPTPMDTADSMVTTQPLGFNLGTQEAYDFYAVINEELKEKIREKKGVVASEKYRLIWAGGLPSWFALDDFNYYKNKGATFPVEITYRNAERIESLDLPKTNDPLEYLAWRWVRYWTHYYDKAWKRPGSLPKVERIIEYIEDYQCDGAVFNSAFSCRSWHAGIVQQTEVLRKVCGDIPILVMEGDIVDASSYNEADTHNRIDAFIEAIDAAKG